MASMVAIVAVTGAPAAMATAPTTTTTELSAPSTAYLWVDTPVVATVSPIPDGGQVEFHYTSNGSSNPDQVAGSASVDEAGNATFTFSFTAVRTYTVWAIYTGTSLFGSSRSTSHAVDADRQPVDISLVVDTPTIHAGDDFVARVTVDPAPDDAPFDPATVHFALSAHGQGATYTAEVLPDAVTGVATLAVHSSSLIPERWTVSAWFGPTPKYKATPTKADTFRFEPVPPLVDLDISPLTAYVGDPVTITATVDPTPTGGGSIELFEMGPVGVDPVSIGSAPVVGGSAQFIRSFDQNEGLQLRAVFSGTATSAPSQSPITERKQIGPPFDWIGSGPNTWDGRSTPTFVFDDINDPFYQRSVSDECAIDSGAWTSCASPYTTPALADGLHTFRVRGTDANGHVQTNPDSRTWHVDTTPPDVTMKLNGGSLWTNNPVVTVSLAATDQSYPTEYRLDNALTYDDQGLLNENGPFQTYVSTTTWDTTYALQHGTPGDGVKTVYAQVSDLLFHWSAIVSASITLDRGDPVVDQPTAAIATGALGSMIPIAINWRNATDAVSGVASRAYQRKVGSGNWKPITTVPSIVAAPDALTPGSTYRYEQRAVDNATNVGSWSAVLVCKPQLRQENAAGVTHSSGWTRKSVSSASGDTSYGALRPDPG